MCACCTLQDSLLRLTRLKIIFTNRLCPGPGCNHCYILFFFFCKFTVTSRLGNKNVWISCCIHINSCSSPDANKMGNVYHPFAAEYANPTAMWGHFWETLVMLQTTHWSLIIHSPPLLNCVGCLTIILYVLVSTGLETHSRSIGQKKVL